MARNSWANIPSPQASVSAQPTKLCQQTMKFPSWCCFLFEPCSRGVLCAHINIQQKNPNFQTSNPTPTQLGKWTVFIPRTATFTYIHKVHTRIMLGFLEKHTNTFKRSLWPLNLQDASGSWKEKNLTIWVVSNADFLPCYNGCVIRKITNIVEILSEHARTQVKMCG
jgi:hypothetical protein